VTPWPFTFVDSSALVKRYRNEAGSPSVADLFNRADRIIISRLTALEVSAALVRRGRVAGVLPGDVIATLAILDRNTQNSFHVVELDSVVINRAVLLTRRYGLRAADAIQLSSALFTNDETRPAQLIVLASDKELNTAAAAEGLKTLDPTEA